MDDIAAALRALLPGAGVGVADPALDHPLWPGEAIAAIPRRQREFAAGRAAARAALAAAGLPAAAIPQNPDRSPAFPPGLAASVAHSATVAIAAVHPGLRALGIDLEPVAPFDPALIPDTTRPDDPPDLSPLARFVLREAAYKAQFPLTRRLLSFHEVRLTDRGALTAEMPGLPPLTLRLAQAQGHWIAAATL